MVNAYILHIYDQRIDKSKKKNLYEKPLKMQKFHPKFDSLHDFYGWFFSLKGPAYFFAKIKEAYTLRTKKREKKEENSNWHIHTGDKCA